LRARITAEQAAAFVALLRSACELRADPRVPSPLTPDPRDDHLVALAGTAEVGHVVSGDPHLTEAAGSPVLTPPRGAAGTPRPEPVAGPRAGQPGPGS